MGSPRQCCTRGSLPVGRPDPCRRGCPRHLAGTRCHPKAQPNRTAGKAAAACVHLPGYFRSGTGEISLRGPRLDSEGMQPIFPRSDAVGYTRPEKSQGDAAPGAASGGRVTRPHTAGRLKPRTEPKAPGPTASWKTDPAAAGTFHVSYCTNALQSDLRVGKRSALIPAEVGPFEFQKRKARSAQLARYPIPSKCTVKVPQ